METHEILHSALIFLGTAVVSVPLFKRLGLGSVLGYLAGGALIGPWGLRLITDSERIMQFSELGVVLLLFIIGLELKPKRLWVMRRLVFGLGSAQVGLTGLVFALIAWLSGFSSSASVVIGLSLSLSSTAFALQILGERRQLGSNFGRASFGVLLFQDLAAIPLIAAVPLLAHSGKALESNWILSAGRDVIIVGVLMGAGRLVLQPLLRLIAGAKIQEIFTAASLLIVFGVALLMEKIGLSMALGAFLAGMLLADSEHRHELEADIEPFKGLLLGLFFISIGMSVDFGLLISKPLLIIALVMGLVSLKASVLYGLGRLFSLKRHEARAMAATISQGGEFAFVVIGSAAASAVIDREISSQMTLVVTLSMALTPFLVIGDQILRKRDSEREKPPFDVISDDENPVLIAGFGRVGQIIGRILRVRGVGFTALEHDQEQVNVLRRFGNKVHYGDASRIELLAAAGAAKARFFVLAVDDVESSLKIATIVRQHFPHLKIFARARNRQHSYELLALGVTTIFRETLGTSLEMAGDLMRELGFGEAETRETIRKFRNHDEGMLLQQFNVRHDEKELIQYSKQYAQQLSELFSADRAEAMSVAPRSE